MIEVILKRFEHPDETRIFEKGRPDRREARHAILCPAPQG